MSKEKLRGHGKVERQLFIFLLDHSNSLSTYLLKIFLFYTPAT